MAGLAEMIGMPQVSKAIDPRRNMLLGLAAGLVGGPTWGQGLSNGFQLAAQGGALDQQAAEKLKAETKIAAQTDTLKNWLLNDRKRPDLVPLLDAGMSPGEVFNQALKPPGEAQNPYMNLGDGNLFNWQTGERLNNPNALPPQPDYPTSYDEHLLAQRDPAYAARLEAGKGGATLTDADVRAEKLASVVQGDKALLLGDGTNKGIYDALSDPWSQIAGADVGVGGVGIGKPGYALTSADYQSAQNALTNIAQSYLYAISGQAAPAGEVAKIVQSVTPVLGESKTSVDNKKKRLASYIAAIETSKRDVQGGGMGGGEWTVLGVE